MNKGFTLMEVLVVIVVLAIVFSISVPVVTNYLKTVEEKTYQRQIESIESAAEGWAAKNLNVLPENDGDFITIYLGELKNAGLIKDDLRNPISNELFFDDIEIIITKTSSSYEFEVRPETGTGTTDFSTLDPVVVLIGSSTEESELNTPYIEKGINVTDRFGKRVTEYDVIYKSNGLEIASIDTSRLGIYTVHYIVNGMNDDIEVVRTVEITDKTPPTLSFPASTEIFVEEVAGFDVMQGVIASDNSGEVVDIQVSGNLSAIPGSYQITYTLTDTSNNTDIFIRTINVIESEVYTYYSADEGVNVPQIRTGMTPVKWNGSAWVFTTTSDPEWYDYANFKWANAVTSDCINPSQPDTCSMWVWIPRYAYNIPNNFHTSTAELINVKFLKDNTLKASDNSFAETVPTYSGSSQTNFVLHPSFTFESDIPGFWIAKFEPSVANHADSCYITLSRTNCDKTTMTAQFIPNVYLWGYINVGNGFTVSLEMQNKNSVYGWNSNEVDTHMMKNTEYGATVYLAHSLYGKFSNPIYDGTVGLEKYIWSNTYLNGTRVMTGCAANSAYPSDSTLCNTYETTNGVKTSTTGNVTGVYGLVGGAHEYVAAYLNNNSTYINTFGSSLVSAASKYKDIYQATANDGTTDLELGNYNLAISKFGDAIYETSNLSAGTSSSWYSRNTYFVYQDFPFIQRGGSYLSADRPGMFSFERDMGGSMYDITFRTVVIAE